MEKPCRHSASHWGPAGLLRVLGEGASPTLGDPGRRSFAVGVRRPRAVAVGPGWDHRPCGYGVSSPSIDEWQSNHPRRDPGRPSF
jgi:hypothetical protein